MAAPGSAGSRFKSYLAAPVVLVLVVFGAAALWLDRPLAEKLTLGTILVDTPEIYTRERLVNDRFLQDAWLSARLDLPEIRDARQVRGETRGATVQAGDVKERASPQTNPGADAASGPPQGVEPRLASKVMLLDQVDYRDVVRNLLIENQLDDRHDLNGNSLYKLKFDTSVLPGVNTQASARIGVRLLVPGFLGADKNIADASSLSELGTKEDIETWRKIYAKWIESLRSRLNQTHQELKDAYRNNEVSHSDYVRLIRFFSIQLRIPPATVAECPSQVVSHGQDSTSLRLSSEEHAVRKNCVKALVEKTVPKTIGTEFDPGEAKLNAYPKTQKFKEETDKARPRRVEDTVDLWLNSFFAARTVKLVLGVPVHELAFANEGIHNVPAFQNLARLTFFNSVFQPGERSVFEVSEKIFAITAVEPTQLKTDNLETLGLKQVQGQNLTDFTAADFAPGRYLISSQYPPELRDERVRFGEHEFRDISMGQGVYQVSAEVGLLNFAKLARQNMAAFTYGVSPKESADTVYLNLSSRSNVAGEAPGTADSSAIALHLQRERYSRTVERRSGIVGFSGVSSDAKSPASGAPPTQRATRNAEFGWLIAPRQTAMNGREPVYVQVPAQYALSALVSIPSWWHTARFEVTTSWQDKNGEVIPGTQKVSRYEVDVPTDFEPLEALLLGIDQVGPEIMESRLDPVWLTACRPGAIVIPGRRLWRSTKVTLGYQTASAISVLPNMKGIIATFDSVENQLSVAEEAAWKNKHPAVPVQIQRAVRVWTSQGSLTLPTFATIGIPGNAAAPCPNPRPPDVAAAK